MRLSLEHCADWKVRGWVTVSRFWQWPLDRRIIKRWNIIVASSATTNVLTMWCCTNDPRTVNANTHCASITWYVSNWVDCSELKASKSVAYREGVGVFKLFRIQNYLQFAWVVLSKSPFSSFMQSFSKLWNFARIFVKLKMFFSQQTFFSEFIFGFRSRPKYDYNIRHCAEYHRQNNSCTVLYTFSFTFAP